ncbi:MAG: glycoside hydrolase family 88 protein [Bacteroidales bacterium]|nr:glycoside hydrolase family 88 protein [Bacteroidales bacterium]
MFKKIFYSLLAVTLLCGVVSCQESVSHVGKRVFKVAQQQFKLLDARLEPGEMPRTLNADGTPRNNTSISYWCTGFYPGSLWYVYEYTGDPEIKALAEKHTHYLDTIVRARTHHDIGFQVNSSFGNAYRLTGDKAYLPYIESAAAKLAKRFNPVVGVIKSWESNKKWAYPVIIDNMMNLELLERASKLFSCDSLDQIAKTHARTTMKNHFRDDYTTFHVVSYNPEDGSVAIRQTHQGYFDDSAWARGQAWGLYGYTMMARETGEADLLAQAEHIADMLLPRLPEDGVPYWDFDAPDIPNTVRDASAGAIMASAFVELSTLTADPARAKACRQMAEKQIRTLAGPEYLAKVGENGNFLLKHSVGSFPHKSEVDVPLTYADYYFLEAILRYNKLSK